MHHRILVLTVSALAGLFALSATTASAAMLGKGSARGAAQQKAAKYAATAGWASAARLGKCERKSKARVVCLGRIIGAERNCRARVVVWKGKGKRVNTRLRSFGCSTDPGTSTTLLKTIRLRASLSRAPRRDLSDPFRATYDYTAGATSADAAGEEPSTPPSGVQALYVDGILECAENINQAKPEAECPVDHHKLGEYRVTTIYTAGNESATDTMRYTLEPLPTSIDVEVSYEPLEEARLLFTGSDCEPGPCQISAGFFENADMELGTLSVTVSPISPWGTMPKSNCPLGDLEPAPLGCASLPQPTSTSYSLPVEALANLDVAADQDLVEGERIAATMAPPKNVTIPTTNLSQEGVAAVESGVRGFWLRSGEQPGYVPSEVKAPIQFSPTATEHIRFR